MQNGKQCTCCGKKLADSAFYKSLNPKHKDKLTPMCKKCCVKQSLDDAGESVDIERFKNTLHFNDKPYRAELHISARKPGISFQRLSCSFLLPSERVIISYHSCMKF